MTVGQRLQQVRKERKFSLSDIAQQTKIQPWVLEAVESDRLQDLMSPIYVKGFIASYARFLHLDSESLIADMQWAEAVPTQEALPPALAPAPVQVPIRISIPWPVLRRLAPAVAGLLMVAGLVSLHPMRWMSKIPKAMAHRQAGPRLASLAPVQELPKPVPPEPVALVPTQPLELVVTAQRTTLVTLRADGKLLWEQRLMRGVQQRWHADRKFELELAKPTQVDVLLNGQPINAYALTYGGRLLITHRGVVQLPADHH